MPPTNQTSKHHHGFDSLRGVIKCRLHSTKSNTVLGSLQVESIIASPHCDTDTDTDTDTGGQYHECGEAMESMNFLAGWSFRKNTVEDRIG